MYCQSIVIAILLVLVLGLGFEWWIYNWQWWAVLVPSAIAMAVVETIEGEIRGWR